MTAQQKLRLLAKDLTKEFPRSPRETLAGYVIAARAVDVLKFKGQTTEGEPATPAHLRRYIVLVLITNAESSIRTFGFGFIGNGIWDPNTNQFGALPFIFGTLVTSGIALLLGVPVSLGIAIFLVELAPGSVRTPLAYVVELLAAIPSVVYGLWGIFVLVPWVRSLELLIAIYQSARDGERVGLPLKY